MPTIARRDFWCIHGRPKSQRRFAAAVGTTSGRVRDGQEPLLERSGAAQETPRAAGDGPKAFPQTVPKRQPGVIGALSVVECACGTNFCRFCLVARKLRCASRTNFYNVLLSSNEIDTKCVGTPKTIENRPKQTKNGARPPDRPHFWIVWVDF